MCLNRFLTISIILIIKIKSDFRVPGIHRCYNGDRGHLVLENHLIRQDQAFKQTQLNNSLQLSKHILLDYDTSAYDTLAL